MNILQKLFKLRPEVQNIFEEMGEQRSSSGLIKPIFSQNTVSYKLNASSSDLTPDQFMELATDPVSGSQQLIYFAQLFSEKLALVSEDCVFIGWSNLYKLLSDINHEDSSYLLSLPKVDKSVPVLGEVGTVSDDFFRLKIDGWRSYAGDTVKYRKFLGGVFQDAENSALLSKEAWQLIDLISNQNGFDNKSRSQVENEVLWGEVRQLALNANAELSPYLASTVVLVPSLLKIRY